MKHYYTCFFLLLLLFIGSSFRGNAQISLTAPVNYDQNFNGYLGTSAASLPAGWSIGGSFSYRGQGNGSSNSGGSWAYGTGTDRSLGYLGSGTSPNLNYNVSFVNSTGNVLTTLVISYDFEQWRFAGGNTNGWSVTGTGALAAVNLAGLNTTSALNGPTGTAVVTPKSVTLTGLNIAPGAVFGIRWACSDGSGSDNGISVDNFHLEAPCNPSAPVSLDTTLCAGATFIWNSNTYTTAQTIIDTFTNSQGCDSFVQVALDFYPFNTHSFADTVCNGQSYTWGTQTLNASGTFSQTFSAATGCDSVVTLNLFVRPAITHSFADTVCNGQTYTWGTQTLNASGTFSQTFSAATGCDSVVALSLFVRPAITHSFADTVCNGQSYTWGTQTLNTSGTYNQTFSAATGCDSVVTLSLFVRPAITHSFADTVCNGQSYTWGTQTLNTSGTYNQIFSAATGCDSVVTLNLFVRPAITHSFADTVCNGQTYAWGTQTLNASGTYNQTFNAATGCDSVVTLSLFIRPAITHSFADTVCNGQAYAWGTQTLNTTGTYNQTFSAATGCDSIVTLNLFVRPAITHSFADTVCNGQSYTWGIQTLNASGTYNQTFNAATGCDSVVTLNLFIRPAITHSFADTVCNGQTYAWGTQTLNASGTYNQTFSAATGCDSIVTLNLFVRPAITHSFADTVCNGQTYTWGTQTLNASGTFSQTFSAATGCDSVVTLNLFIRPAITHSFADTVCNGQTYTWGTQTLNASGTYNQTFNAATGCDSVVTLNLFIRPAITHSFADTVCNGQTYAWGTQTLNASGTYSQTFSAATGCDSVVTLNLFIRPAITHSFADTVCNGQSYTWGIQTLNASGTYNQTFNAVTGCDSVVTLNLFVRPTITHSFADTVCNGQSYTWGIQTLNATGTYNQIFNAATGCDSVVTLNLFIRPAITHNASATICSGTTYSFGSQTLSAGGVYTEIFAAQSGCDSMVTLNLVVNPSILHATTVQTCYGTSYTWGTQVLNASGIYVQTFTAAGGCDSIVTLTFVVDAEITHSANASICHGDSYTFGPQTLNASGTYSQVFTAANGCDSAVTLSLTVKPAISHTANAHSCFGMPYTFGTQVLTLPGTYTQVFPATDGCDSTVTLQLMVSPAPATVHIDTAACGQVVFEGQTYTANTILLDTLVTADGCDSIFRNIQVTVHNNSPLQQSVTASGCGSATYEGMTFYQDTVFHQLFRNSLGCDSLDRMVTVSVWSQYSDTTQVALCRGGSYTFHGKKYTDEGTYSAVYAGNQGCDSVFILELTVWEPPVASIRMPEANNYCIGDQVTLTASGGASYTWKNAMGTELGYGNEQVVSLYESGNEILMEAADANGCRDTASITLEAHPCCDIWLPNAFSPNHDGINDVFKPETKGHPKEYVLQIFDRWGKTIFSSFSVEQGWDGTRGGQPADIATYYYRISGKCVNGEPLDKKGALTLIR